MRGLTVTLLLAMSVLATAFVTLAPSFVGAFVDFYHFSAEQAGLVVASQLTGSSLGVLISLGFRSTVPPRTVVVAALVATAAMDVASAYIHLPGALIVVRGIAGVPAGILYACTNAAIAQMIRPARTFAAATGIQMAFGFVGYLVLPSILARSGTWGAFLLLALGATLSLLLAGFYPRPRPGGLSAYRPWGSIDASSALVLSSLLLNYVANNALWTYLDRIGVTYGVSIDTISRTLAASMIGGLLGAAAAMGLSNTRRPTWYIVASMIVLAACSNLMLASATSFIYGSTVFVFTAGMLFALPFYFTVLAASAQGDRLVILASLVVYAGLALGPLLGSQVAAEGDYRRLILVSEALFVVAAVLAAAALATTRGSIQVRRRDTA